MERSEFVVNLTAIVRKYPLESMPSIALKIYHGTPDHLEPSLLRELFLTTIENNAKLMEMATEHAKHAPGAPIPKI